MTGQAFGRLTVIKRIENYVSPSGCKKSRWECKCQCGNICNVIGRDLTTGKVLSCGCLNSEKTIIFNQNTKHKYNKYDLSGEYGVGWTFNTNKEFYFDLEDYAKIKNYYWYIDKRGYVVTNANNKYISLHALVLNRIGVNDGFEIDHIYGKHTRNDSRKYNLRICTHADNMKNRWLQSNNKTGVPGVYFDDNIGKYKAYITADKKQIYLGIFDNLDAAKAQREIFEIQYFKDYRYKNREA